MPSDLSSSSAPKKERSHKSESSNDISLLTYEEKEKLLVKKSKSFNDLYHLICKHKEDKLVQNSDSLDDLSLLSKSFKRMHFDPLEARARVWDYPDLDILESMAEWWGLPPEKPMVPTDVYDTTTMFDGPRPGIGPITGNPFPSLIKLYALVGLHWYNMLEGTNLLLHHVETVTFRGNLAHCYNINLVADNPDSSSQEVFLVDVSENHGFVLNYDCVFAGPAGTPKKPVKYHRGTNLPEWPTEAALNDRKRFYVMEKPEVCTDLIYLYLRLVVCAQFRWKPESELSYFEPVEVVIEAIEQAAEEQPEPLSEILNHARSAILYIRFKDSRISDPAAADCKAIVRRVFHEDGHFVLDGVVLSGSLIHQAGYRSPVIYP